MLPGWTKPKVEYSGGKAPGAGPRPPPAGAAGAAAAGAPAGGAAFCASELAVQSATVAVVVSAAAAMAAFFFENFMAFSPSSWLSIDSVAEHSQLHQEFPRYKREIPWY